MRLIFKLFSALTCSIVLLGGFAALAQETAETPKPEQEASATPQAQTAPTPETAPPPAKEEKKQTDGLLVASELKPEEPKLILVMDIKPNVGVDKGEAQTVTSLLSAAIQEFKEKGKPKYRVFSQQDLRDYLDKKALEQLLGCEEPQCMVDITKPLNASLIVTGSFGIQGEFKVINLSLVDAEKTEIISRSPVRVRSDEKIVEYIRRGAANLLGEEYTKGELIITEKKQHYIHLGVSYKFLWPEEFSILMPSIHFAYMPRFDNVIVGLEASFGIGKSKSEFVFPPASTGTLNIVDRVFMFDINLKTAYAFMLDTDWVAPYLGGALGATILLTTAGEDKETRKVTEKIDALENFRVGRTQLIWNVQPLAGIIFFPSFDIGIYLEFRYRFSPGMSVYEYEYDFYNTVKKDNEKKVSTSGPVIMGGLNFSFR